MTIPKLPKGVVLFMGWPTLTAKSDDGLYKATLTYLREGLLSLTLWGEGDKLLCLDRVYLPARSLEALGMPIREEAKVIAPLCVEKEFVLEEETP